MLVSRFAVCSRLALRPVGQLLRLLYLHPDLTVCLFLPPQHKFLSLFVLVASASAFAPAPFGARVSTRVGMADKAYGKYDDQLWSNDGAFCRCRSD